MLDAAETYRLMPDVQIVRRENALLLVSGQTGASVRVSPAAESLLPMLQSGAGMQELRAFLQTRHPQAGDVGPKLELFLQPLLRLQLLAAGDVSAKVRRGWTRINLFRIDPFARRIAAALLWFPQMLRWTVLALLLLGACAGIAQLALTHQFPSGRGIVKQFSFAGLFFFALVVVSVHELGHAVACRMAGVEVGYAGIVFHGGLIPGPFVETSNAYRVQGRWQRFCIPAAGPLVNFLSAGAAAWVLVLVVPGHPELQDAVRFVFMVSLLFVYFDTNPFGPTDGSYMLGALLDDELAKRNAFSFRQLRPGDRPAAVRYRIVAMVHALTGTTLIGLWLV